MKKAYSIAFFLIMILFFIFGCQSQSSSLTTRDMEPTSQIVSRASSSRIEGETPSTLPAAINQPQDSNKTSFTKLDDQSTLSDYLTYAAMNNQGLKAAFNNWKAALEQIPQAKSLSDPVISYGYATRPTPQRSMFEIMQMFPWFGTFDARSEQAQSMAQSAAMQYDALKLQVIYDVKKGFYELSYLSQAIKVTKDNLELVRHLEEVVRIRYAASSATHPDLIRTQIEQDELENKIISLEKQKPALIAGLNSILDRPTDSDISSTDQIEYKPLQIDMLKLSETINKSNPRLQAMDYEVKSAESEQILTQKSFYPEFGVGVGVDAGMGENMNSRTMVKVQLSLPIWRDNYKAAERQAQAQLSRTKHLRMQMANDLAAQAQKIFYELENSRREVELYRDVIIPKAKEMLATSETAYQTGVRDFLNLIDAQRKLLDYRLMYEQAKSNYAIKLAELEMVVGEHL
jgi:cobalt-zinc-cadmium efflux system outer membrane protein